MAIHFHFQKPTSLLNRRLLKSFISDIFEKEEKEVGQIDFVFCDNAYLLGINQTFLKHDYFTDVVSFNLTDTGSSKIEGEIYISVDMVRENSVRFKVSFARELTRVIFHGILHLCGYDDLKQRDKLLMKRKENFYIAAFLDSTENITL